MDNLFRMAFEVWSTVLTRSGVHKGYNNRTGAHSSQRGGVDIAHSHYKRVH